MKKVFILLFIVFVSVFLSMYFGVFDEYIPVKNEGYVSEAVNPTTSENNSYTAAMGDGASQNSQEMGIPSNSEISTQGKLDNEELSNNYIKAAVDRVVDGDTIVVTTESGSNIKVRYIGIDTPESVHSDESKNTEEGKIASARNKEIISSAGDIVYLEYDVQATDKYGRSLCYVYVKNGNSYEMIQDKLLSEGLCRIMTIQPNSKNANHFYELQQTARNGKKGFWGTGFYS